MPDQSPSHLLTRKADLLAALRLLQQDHEEGAVDAGAYQIAKHRYEQETVEILEQLDALPENDTVPISTKDVGAAIKGAPRVSPWIFVAGTALLVFGALVIFLISSLHSRSSAPVATGAAGQSGTRPASAQVIAAERQVQAHPRNVTDLVTLGNAYLENGQPTSADGTYQAAMQLDPVAPQPATLHAMILGYAGKGTKALALLHQVERQHSSYSRAWLLDGVFSSHNPRRLNTAIHAWKRFLMLSPRSVMSKQVHSWIAGAEKAQKKRK
jgi:cytochrome c-type biogenesis protein CcmH/NrfG